MYFVLIVALIPVSEEVRSNLRPGNKKDLDGTTLPYPRKLESSGKTGSATSIDSQVSIVITTSTSPRPDDDPSDQAFVWPTECQSMLLDPGIVNDTQTQALLLTTLVRFSFIWLQEDKNLKTSPGRSVEFEVIWKHGALVSDCSGFAVTLHLRENLKCIILIINLFSSQAILLEHITGDVETRYLYEVLAEASLVFPGVFPVM